MHTHVEGDEPCLQKVKLPSCSLQLISHTSHIFVHAHSGIHDGGMCTWVSSCKQGETSQHRNSGDTARDDSLRPRGHKCGIGKRSHKPRLQSDTNNCNEKMPARSVLDMVATRLDRNRNCDARPSQTSLDGGLQDRPALLHSHSADVLGRCRRFDILLKTHRGRCPGTEESVQDVPSQSTPDIRSCLQG